MIAANAYHNHTVSVVCQEIELEFWSDRDAASLSSLWAVIQFGSQSGDLS